MYLTTNNEEKRGHELENVQGGVYGKVWKEEREGEKQCNFIMTSKNM